MFEDYFSQDLKEGEKVVKIVRKHRASFIWPAFKTFLILVIPCFLVSFLFASLPGIVVFLICIAVGVGYGLHQWIEWYLDIFVLTNQRIINIDQKGLFSRQVSEFGYKGVQRVTYGISGFLATAFGFGDVMLKSVESDKEIIMKSTAEPQKVQEAIVNIQRQQGVSAQELVDLITQSKSNPDENEAINPTTETELTESTNQEKNSKESKALFKDREI